MQHKDKKKWTRSNFSNNLLDITFEIHIYLRKKQTSNSG